MKKTIDKIVEFYSRNCESFVNLTNVENTLKRNGHNPKLANDVMERALGVKKFLEVEGCQTVGDYRKQILASLKEIRKDFAGIATGDFGEVMYTEADDKWAKEKMVEVRKMDFASLKKFDKDNF